VRTETFVSANPAVLTADSRQQTAVSRQPTADTANISVSFTQQRRYSSFYVIMAAELDSQIFVISLQKREDNKFVIN
jgi:hypothetical protein